jgi:hypothetical protein
MKLETVHMNIFVSHTCPKISAQNLPNILVNKMIIESAQILSTAHSVLDGCQVGYKPTHTNHPSCKWARSTSSNYKWLYEHFKALCEEYTFRTGKVHKTSELLAVLCNQPNSIKIGELELFAMCMPEGFQKLGIFDQTIAYRAYLVEKFSEWACREKPIKVTWGLGARPDWV